jgi:hypothetical protein
VHIEAKPSCSRDRSLIGKSACSLSQVIRENEELLVSYHKCLSWEDVTDVRGDN